MKYPSAQSFRQNFLLFSLVLSSPGFAASIATSSVDASRAGQEILKKGGNAFDAACAAVFAQGVAQSYFTGIGGGGAAVIYQNGRQTFYDFREQAPSATTSKLFSTINPKAEDAWSQRNTGGRSVGIPGNVAACGMLVQKYGKLKWAEILQPAIKLAQNGFVVSQMYSEELGDQWKRISPFALTQSIFKGKGGEGVKKGEVVKQPLLAQTLESLAKNGAQSFYVGKLAEGWTHEAQAMGVKITSSDLKNYKVQEASPIEFEFGKYRGSTAVPPYGAGYTVAGVLRFLSQFQHRYGIPEKTSALRHIAELEAFTHFGELRDQRIADASKVKQPLNQFLNSKQEQSAWAAIENKIKARLLKIGGTLKPIRDADSSLSSPDVRVSQPAPGKISSHTSHISVVDDLGNVVALTSSINNIYGSGITVPNYGFLLNSTLGDFDPAPGKLNSPGAQMRPRSNMSPTLIFENGEPIASIGAAGGSLIPMAVVQFLQNYYVYQMDAKSSVQFARVSIDGNAVEIEESAGDALLGQLKTAGYEAKATKTIWAVFNGVVRKNAKAKWESVTDSRYDGAAL